jgi:hypothetical protein
MPKPFPRTLSALVTIGALLLLILTAACGGGDSASPTATTSGSSDHPDPEPSLRGMIDSFNAEDVQTFYNGLSADRRATTTVADLQAALSAAQLLAGVVPKLEVTEITAKRINGDAAEIDTTLALVITNQRIPVTDTAQMKWEDGSWHLADHFIDQALAVLSLGGAPRATATP